MINPPPKTGDTALDNFLRGVYEQSRELEAKALPEDGWSLTDFTAEVSGVIGDKRDLIDIVTQYDSIEDYLALVDDQKQLLEDALTKVESIEVSADWFAQIMEWWDQNYKIIQDAQESLTYKREADAAALEAKQYAEKTEQDRAETEQSLADAREAASDAASYRQSALTYRDSSKRYSEASEAAKALSEAAQALSEQFRDGAKAHRDATKVSETNAAASASAASTDANKSAGSATEAAGEVTKAEAAREQVEAVEVALRALMADTEAWQDVSFALESVDNRISTGMQQVKNDILGGVGPAFDTLLELAEALGENADAIGTLTNELAKKADKGHKHTSADITDATTFLDSGDNTKVVKTGSDGHIHSGQSPTGYNHLTRRGWVDGQLDKKANTSHTHTISETSGLQTALDGKAPESHIHSIGEVDGLEAQLNSKALKSDLDELEGVLPDFQDGVAYLRFKRTVTAWQWLVPDSPYREPGQYTFRVPAGDYHVIVDGANNTARGIQFNGLPVADREIRLPNERWASFDVSLPNGSTIQTQDSGGQIGDDVHLAMIPAEMWKALEVQFLRENDTLTRAIRSTQRDFTLDMVLEGDDGYYTAQNRPEDMAGANSWQVVPPKGTYRITTVGAEDYRFRVMRNGGSSRYKEAGESSLNAEYELSGDDHLLFGVNGEHPAGTEFTARIYQVDPLKADKGHTHTSSEISDATSVLHANYPDRVVKTRDDGQIYVYTNTVTKGNSVANKEYVDTEVSKKANTSHTHASADISDTTSELTSIRPNKVVRTNGDGAIDIHNHTITGDYSATNKAYVDGEVAKKANTSHKHVISDVTGLQAAIDDAAGAATWSELAGKPSTFPPSTHSHTISNVTGLQAALDAKANSSHSHSWGQVTGKPSTFTPSSHTHTWSQVTGKPDVATKGDVDDRTPPIKVVDSLPSNPAADTLYFVKE